MSEAPANAPAFEVTIERVGPDVLRIGIAAVDPEALVDLSVETGAAHAYLARVRVRVDADGASAQERWTGTDAELSGAGIADERLVFPEQAIRTGAEVTVAVALRLSLWRARGELAAAVDLVGEGRLAAGERVTKVRLEPGVLADLPFEAPTTDEASVRPAALPALPPTDEVIAVLPEVGLVAGSPALLHGPAGARALPDFPDLSRTRPYDRAATAGVSGALALVWGDSERGLQLSLLTGAALERRHDLARRGGDAFYPGEGRFDPDGRWVVVSSGVKTAARIDAASGTVTWRERLHADLHELAVDIGAGAIVCAGAGEWRVLDPELGKTRARAWLPTTSAGAALAATADGERFAWTASFAAIDAPLGAIAWYDLGTRAGGQLLVPDALVDARLAVLADGRLVAVGTSTWLVDPAARRVTCLGPRLPLPQRPLVTRGRRLWTLDPARWFVDL